MKRTTKRLKSIGLDERRAACSYFQDMAEEGLILEDAGLLCYTFRKDLPQRVRYSIQNFPKGCSKEDAQLMKDCGWTFLCDDDEYYLFRGEDHAKEVEIAIEDQVERWRIRQEESSKNISTMLKAGGTYLILNLFLAISSGVSDAILVLYVTLGLFWLYQMAGELLSLKKAKGRAESLTSDFGITESHLLWVAGYLLFGALQCFMKHERARKVRQEVFWGKKDNRDWMGVQRENQYYWIAFFIFMLVHVIYYV
ncbi:DUF2812 domain-containing protein [Anaerotignum sp. MB30-C6]|uniref:DUF2812 domain-containing protein n=1 Tax=Anaerotignum sp. MB30-C6 TaxID=3070814 RepID=UPI0027DE9C58|nr:DUF2812 domain-containing protein [Anaerotignum sp. MB30-C6]WMI81516.1 DUF2812 domain-containing protein [Anaerotignum sp. MB30-C6]